jgi:hypothetical protein
MIVQIIISKKCLFAVLACLLSSIANASNFIDSCSTESSSAEQNEKLLYVNLTGIGVVTAWGVTKWDYFTNSPQSRSEGWFQNDTKSGGADKLGHLYTSYVTAHGLSHLYETWCFDKNDAALYGAMSSFAILSYMEVGDAFSDFGFSKEDLFSNAAGVVFGYYLYKDPELANILDLRWEYGFDPQTSDFTTDYENSKYLFALKLNGFEFARSSLLKHFEIHLGYYTRGFTDPGVVKERNVFIGIGINLTDLFRRHSYKKTATFLKYFQVPGTNVEFERDLNE